MTAQEELAVAEREAQAARDQLTKTLVELQRRLNPRALAREAIEEVREAGVGLGHAALAAARRNPAPLAGIGITLIAFLARRWIGDAFGSFDKADSAETGDKAAEGMRDD